MSAGLLNFKDRDEYNNRLKNESLKYTNFCLKNFTLKKFENDKLFFQTESYIVVLEGVILNKMNLQKDSDDWGEVVIKMYEELGDSFFSKFRGSFSGYFYDKKADKSLVFVDQIGSKPIYYYMRQDEIYLSSEISDMYKLLKHNNIEYSLCLDSASRLLSMGYMSEDNTLCADIKKLVSGTFIRKVKNNTELINYYTLKESEIDLEEDQIIELLDKKFRKAVALQFDKDKEYSYQHLVALSGGLDSRITSLVAHDLGYVNQTNFTFSQSGYLDETIAKTIASDFKHEWIFKSLDNGLFLKDIEEITKVTGGNALYYGLAHGNSMFKNMNFDSFGMVHSGQLGDVIIGSYINNLKEKNLLSVGGRFSSDKNFNSSVSSFFTSFKEKELSMIYDRGFNGINEGLKTSQIYTETMSPFYDIDFMEFCMSIPLKIRLNHKLYKKWVLKKYPLANNYIWEKTKKKISYRTFSISYNGKTIERNRIPKLILVKLKLCSPSTETKNHMNPLQFWYNTNTEIKNFQENYFNLNINQIKDDTLKEECERMFTKGGAIEKNKVLSLLSANKLFFNEAF